jgi:hypothetical protein
MDRLNQSTVACGDSLQAEQYFQILDARIESDQSETVPHFNACYWHIDVIR